MARKIHTRCHDCGVDSTHLHSRRYGWQVRITVLPDEHHYLTSPCSNCGGWTFEQLDVDQIARLIAADVPVEDLSLIDPGVCAESIAHATVHEQAHMYWLAYIAHPSVLSGVIGAAVDKMLEGTQ